MFLLDEYEISKWAYYYCRDVKDDPEIKKYITDSRWSYQYCKFINDDPEISKFITTPIWAYGYCRDVNKNDERLMELAKKYKDRKYE